MMTIGTMHPAEAGPDGGRTVEGSRVGRVSAVAPWAFVLGGVVLAWGTGLRWFAPGYEMGQRLNDDMSPVLPGRLDLVVPGSVEFTAAGYLVLTLAWIALAATAATGWRSVVFRLGCLVQGWLCAEFGVLTAWTWLTRAEPGLSPVVRELIQWPGSFSVLGVGWVLVAVGLLDRARPARLVAVVVSVPTVMLAEMFLLAPFSDAWDDPAGFGTLSGVAYVLFGLALVWDRVTDGRMRARTS